MTETNTHCDFLNLIESPDPSFLDFQQMQDVISLMEGINRNIPFQQTLEYIFASFQKYIPYTHIGVALLEGELIRATFAVSNPEHAELKTKLLGYGTDIRKTSLPSVLKSRSIRIIDDLEAYTAGKPLQPYNHLLLEAGIRSSITFPLMNEDVPVGILFFSSDRTRIYTEKHVWFLHILENSLMLALERGILQENMVLSSSLALATMVEERDKTIGGHLLRMKKYSRKLSELLYQERKFPDEIDFAFITDIDRFSPLHDIGKVSIRDHILLKPGSLTREEFKIMQTHTVYGGKVLRRADETLRAWGRGIYQMGIEIAEGHHEKWDGSGYPYGLKGEEIPLSARIVAICDVFDALTSPRVYKPAFPVDKAFQLMQEANGSHFDPVIFEVFEKNKIRFVQLYKLFQSGESVVGL